MGFVRRYVEYLRHNPGRYWYKRKLYGWGWVPATWQGWLSLAFFVLVLVMIVVLFMQHPEPTGQDVLLFLGKVALWVAALIGLCYLTGEPPKWQWGFPKDL